MTQKRKPKSKNFSHRFHRRVLDKPICYSTKESVETVIEHLNHIPIEIQTYHFFTSKFSVQSEQFDGHYEFAIEVFDKNMQAVFTSAVGTIYSSENDETVIQGTVSLGGNLVFIMLLLLIIALSILQFFDDVILQRVFALIVFMSTPVYVFLDLFLKRRLLIQQLESIASSAKQKHIPEPISEHESDDPKTQTRVQ